MLTKNINPIKCAEYLLSLDEETKVYAEKIINNTIFISTERMIEMVKSSFLKFQESCPSYNLYVPDDKIGSDHYILLQLKDYLKPVQVLYGLDKNPENDFPIIILDDAIYSSVHMCSFIDYMRLKHWTNKVILIVAVLSTWSVQVLTDSYFKEVEIFCELCLEDIIAEKLLGDKMKLFGCESSYVLPLIFEHKIANEFGSYGFYHKIMDIPISRNKIDKITVKDIEEMVQNF